MDVRAFLVLEEEVDVGVVGIFEESMGGCKNDCSLDWIELSAGIESDGATRPVCCCSIVSTASKSSPTLLIVS